MRPGLVRYYAASFGMVGVAAAFISPWFALLGLVFLVEVGCDVRAALERK